MEQIRNICDKATPFARKHQLVSIPTKVSGIKTFGDRKSLANNFVEFSHILSTKFPSSKHIFARNNMPPIMHSHNANLDKDQYKTKIKISELYVNFCEFSSQDDFP